MTREPFVDAHHHIWDLSAVRYPWLQDAPRPVFRYGDYAAIRRPFLPADFRRDTARQNVVATVHMEAESDPADPLAETKWLHAVAEREGFPNALVAQAWLDRDDVEEVLKAQAGFPLVRGIRHKPAAAASPDAVVRGAPGSMGDPRWRAGYALLEENGLSFDLQTPWWHLGEAAELARDFPATAIILNHSGLPADRSPAAIARWRAAMAELATCPNVAVKISGIGQPGRPWTVEDNSGIVRTIIELFGTDRCLFASNWPVDSLCAASYDTIIDGFRTIVADLPPGERRKLFHDNAIRIYRIFI